MCIIHDGGLLQESFARLFPWRNVFEIMGTEDHVIFLCGALEHGCSMLWKNMEGAMGGGVANSQHRARGLLTAPS